MSSKAGNAGGKNLPNSSNAMDESANANNLMDLLSGAPSPVVSMVSKHSNGTLNLWQLTFADRTKFSQVNHLVNSNF